MVEIVNRSKVLLRMLEITQLRAYSYLNIFEIYLLMKSSLFIFCFFFFLPYTLSN